MKRVVVIGSGLAGLSAGYRLQEQGCHVTVFETLDRVGGRVLSESEEGFLFDVGPTIVTDNFTEYMKLVRDVGFSSFVDFRFSLHPRCPSCSAQRSMSTMYGMPMGPVEEPWIAAMGCCVQPWEWLCGSCAARWRVPRMRLTPSRLGTTSSE